MISNGSISIESIHSICWTRRPILSKLMGIEWKRPVYGVKSRKNGRDKTCFWGRSSIVVALRAFVMIIGCFWLEWCWSDPKTTEKTLSVILPFIGMTTENGPRSDKPGDAMKLFFRNSERDLRPRFSQVQLCHPAFNINSLAHCLIFRVHYI